MKKIRTTKVNDDGKPYQEMTVCTSTAASHPIPCRKRVKITAVSSLRVVKLQTLLFQAAFAILVSSPLS